MIIDLLDRQILVQVTNIFKHRHFCCYLVNLVVYSHCWWSFQELHLLDTDRMKVGTSKTSVRVYYEYNIDGRCGSRNMMLT